MSEPSSPVEEQEVPVPEWVSEDWDNVYLLGELLLYFDLVEEYSLFFQFQREQVGLRIRFLDPNELKGVSWSKAPFIEILRQGHLWSDNRGEQLYPPNTHENVVAEILHTFCRESLLIQFAEEEEEGQHVSFSTIYHADLASRLRPGQSQRTPQFEDPSLVFFSKEVFRLLRNRGVYLYDSIVFNTKHSRDRALLKNAITRTLTLTPLEVTFCPKDSETPVPDFKGSPLPSKGSPDFVSTLGFQYRTFPYHVISGFNLWSMFLGGLWQSRLGLANFVRHDYAVAMKKSDHELLIRQEQKKSSIPLYLVKRPTTTRNEQMIEENGGIDSDSVREAALLIQLRHPHILPLLETHLIDDPLLRNKMPHLIFPFMSDTLLTWRLSRKQVSMKSLVQIAIQLLDVILYLHATEDVVHRNLHPHAIFLHLRPEGKEASLQSQPVRS